MNNIILCAEDNSRLSIFIPWAKKELLTNILPFWERYGKDETSGGFFGYLDNQNHGDATVPRSIVMTARHLWTYSAASRLLKEASYLSMADFAYQTIHDHFIDFEYGGVYWTVYPDGTPEISKKQVYGEAFALYGLSEYAAALHELKSNNRESVTSVGVFQEALHIYDLLETHCRDYEYGGYWEARGRNWEPTTDLKLSPKDVDCDKSMNTNLHVLEALSTWFQAIQICHPENTALLNKVQDSLKDLVQVTISHIIGYDGHLNLYFTRYWDKMGEDCISYGHDIEASWLLWEAVKIVDSPEVYAAVKPIVLNLAEVSLQEGFDQDTGALDNEFHRGHRDTTRIWWCQAEALIGYVNAYQITGDERWLDAAVRVQQWIETYQVDHTNGDWFQAVSREGLPDMRLEKGGNWKTSYHNGRCCMELLRRNNCDSYQI